MVTTECAAACIKLHSCEIIVHSSIHCNIGQRDIQKLFIQKLFKQLWYSVQRRLLTRKKTFILDVWQGFEYAFVGYFSKCQEYEIVYCIKCRNNEELFPKVLWKNEWGLKKNKPKYRTDKKRMIKGKQNFFQTVKTTYFLRAFYPVENCDTMIYSWRRCFRIAGITVLI